MNRYAFLLVPIVSEQPWRYKMNNRYILIRIFGIFIFSCFASQSMATNWPTTKAEFSRLPAYCLARHGPKYGISVPESEINKWKRILGAGFLHVHHFCAGLNTLRILDRKIPEKHELIGVLGEFEYTQRHSPKDLPLLPRIHVEKGKLLLRLDRNGEAVREFLQAIKLKPDYTLPYAELSDYYEKNELTKDAINILEEGLKHSPNSKRLKRRLDKLK